jgi:hypothetical protein
MRHIWSVLCQKSIIDKASNNISLVDLVEEIHISSELVEGAEKDLKALSRVPMYWVTLWARSDPEKPEKNWVKDTIISPSGKTIGGKEYEVDLQEYKRNRRIRSVPIPPSNEQGIYYLQSRLRIEGRKQWKKVAEVPIEVIVDKVSSEKV